VALPPILTATSDAFAAVVAAVTSAPMDFTPSDRVLDLRERIESFLDDHYYPVELEVLTSLDDEVAPGVPYPRILVEMRDRAKAAGLWNLFLPDDEHGGGLSNWEYGILCEVMGRSIAASMVFNCAAPDTGNMEILVDHGTPEQKERWLQPLLEGEIRSCFSMTEPDSAGSDPTNLAATAVLEGDEWVINGHKWFTSGAVGAELAIAMVVTEPEAAPHKRASMILVPTDAPGFNLLRPVSVMGHSGGPGHGEITYEDCRVPADNILGERGKGFVVAQDRLGPGRIHHCMRAIGAAERALELMCKRAMMRDAFGGPLADKQFVQDFVAKSRIEIDQARLLTLHAAWQMDTIGKREARQAISMIKVVAAQVVMDVIDRSMQVHGALGVSDDTPLATLWRGLRMLRLADGPDEVHKMVIARRELNRWGDNQVPDHWREAARTAAIDIYSATARG
jgi:acyl-CoA dehydrogenase